MKEDMDIRVDQISKKYGEASALKGVSFAVNHREIFGLIGPDGAGKTSLIRILATLLLPDGGKASILGMDAVADYRLLRAEIGYMPGRFSLYQDLSVEENLRFFATLFGTTIRENYELIDNIYSHIEPFKDRKAGQLSGGMKQKLALSCALIHRPRVLLLDEPTTGVDAVSRREFWDMLYEIRERGITILVSTPYMDEADRCDRVGLIQAGEILQIETPRGIVEQYERRLFAVKGNDLYGMLRDLRKFEYTHSVFPFGQEIHLAAKEGGEAAIFTSFLENKGHSLREFRTIEPNIEDCFMELMGQPQNPDDERSN